MNRFQVIYQRHAALKSVWLADRERRRLDGEDVREERLTRVASGTPILILRGEYRGAVGFRICGEIFPSEVTGRIVNEDSAPHRPFPFCHSYLHYREHFQIDEVALVSRDVFWKTYDAPKYERAFGLDEEEMQDIDVAIMSFMTKRHEELRFERAQKYRIDTSVTLRELIELSRMYR